MEGDDDDGKAKDAGQQRVGRVGRSVPRVVVVLKSRLARHDVLARLIDPAPVGRATVLHLRSIYDICCRSNMQDGALTVK